MRKNGAGSRDIVRTILTLPEHFEAGAARSALYAFLDHEAYSSSDDKTYPFETIWLCSLLADGVVVINMPILLSDSHK